MNCNKPQINILKWCVFLVIFFNKKLEKLDAFSIVEEFTDYKGELSVWINYNVSTIKDFMKNLINS
jgi:hypothetical protein